MKKNQVKLCKLVFTFYILIFMELAFGSVVDVHKFIRSGALDNPYGNKLNFAGFRPDSTQSSTWDTTSWHTVNGNWAGQSRKWWRDAIIGQRIGRNYVLNNQYYDFTKINEKWGKNTDLYIFHNELCPVPPEKLAEIGFDRNYIEYYASHYEPVDKEGLRTVQVSRLEGNVDEATLMEKSDCTKTALYEATRSNNITKTEVELNERLDHAVNTAKLLANFNTKVHYISVSQVGPDGGLTKALILGIIQQKIKASKKENKTPLFLTVSPIGPETFKKVEDYTVTPYNYIRLNIIPESYDESYSEIEDLAYMYAKNFNNFDTVAERMKYLIDEVSSYGPYVTAFPYDKKETIDSLDIDPALLPYTSKQIIVACSDFYHVNVVSGGYAVDTCPVSRFKSRLKGKKSTITNNIVAPAFKLDYLDGSPAPGGGTSSGIPITAGILGMMMKRIADSEQIPDDSFEETKELTYQECVFKSTKNVKWEYCKDKEKVFTIKETNLCLTGQPCKKIYRYKYKIGKVFKKLLKSNASKDPNIDAKNYMINLPLQYFLSENFSPTAILYCADKTYRSSYCSQRDAEKRELLSSDDDPIEQEILAEAQLNAPYDNITNVTVIDEDQDSLWSPTADSIVFTLDNPLGLDTYSKVNVLPDGIIPLSLKTQGENHCLQQSIDDLHQPGNRIVTGNCDSTVKQQWFFDGEGLIHSAYKAEQCLVVNTRGDGITRYDPLVIGDCVLNDTSNWFYDKESGRIILTTTARSDRGLMCLYYNDSGGASIAPCRYFPGYEGDIRNLWVTNTTVLKNAGSNLCLQQHTDDPVDEMVAVDLNQNGNPVGAFPCDGSFFQQWYFDPKTSQLQSYTNPEKCLVVNTQGDGITKYDPLEIGACDTDVDTSTWSYDEAAQQIVLAYNGMCLYYNDSYTGSISPCRYFPVFGGDTRNLWLTNAMLIKNAASNHCIEQSAANLDQNGNRVESTPCNGTSFQQWYLDPTTSQLQSYTNPEKCLVVNTQGDGITKYDPLEIGACDTDVDTSTWSYDEATQQIVLAYNGMCLYYNGSGGASISPCRYFPVYEGDTRNLWQMPTTASTFNLVPPIGFDDLGIDVYTKSSDNSGYNDEDYDFVLKFTKTASYPIDEHFYFLLDEDERVIASVERGNDLTKNGTDNMEVGFRLPEFIPTTIVKYLKIRIKTKGFSNQHASIIKEVEFDGDGNSYLKWHVHETQADIAAPLKLTTYEGYPKVIFVESEDLPEESQGPSLSNPL